MLEKLVNQKLSLKIPDSNEEVVIDYGMVRRAQLTLRAINHPLRKTIMALIEEKGKCSVTELHTKMEIEQSVCSQHLAILRKAEVVTAVRNGKFVNYVNNSKRIKEVLALAAQIAQPA